MTDPFTPINNLDDLTSVPVGVELAGVGRNPGFNTYLTKTDHDCYVSREGEEWTDREVLMLFSLIWTVGFHNEYFDKKSAEEPRR